MPKIRVIKNDPFRLTITNKDPMKTKDGTEIVDPREVVIEVDQHTLNRYNAAEQEFKAVQELLKEKIKKA